MSLVYYNFIIYQAFLLIKYLFDTYTKKIEQWYASHLKMWMNSLKWFCKFTGSSWILKIHFQIINLWR